MTAKPKAKVKKIEPVKRWYTWEEVLDAKISWPCHQCRLVTPAKRRRK